MVLGVYKAKRHYSYLHIYIYFSASIHQELARYTHSRSIFIMLKDSIKCKSLKFMLTVKAELEQVIYLLCAKY